MNEWHWIITMRWPVYGGQGFGYATVDGTVQLEPGFPRQETYRRVREFVRSQYPDVPGGASVMYFALEPNALPAA